MIIKCSMNKMKLKMRTWRSLLEGMTFEGNLYVYKNLFISFCPCVTVFVGVGLVYV
jgi:hypothetical protein